MAYDHANDMRKKQVTQTPKNVSWTASEIASVLCYVSAVSYHTDDTQRSKKNEAPLSKEAQKNEQIVFHQIDT